jgi:7-keto-8-aminopelargonate synthetase-like enzyme
MIKAGFTIAGEGHPICPVMLGQERLTSVFADEMLGKLHICIQIKAIHKTLMQILIILSLKNIINNFFIVNRNAA